eukprot:12532894-Alexandrium_andersonii.AAC.1
MSASLVGSEMCIRDSPPLWSHPRDASSGDCHGVAPRHKGQRAVPSTEFAHQPLSPEGHGRSRDRLP